MSESSIHTVDLSEVEKFSAMADTWWDQNGPFRPLHQMNPCRLGYIRDQICAETGRDERHLRALDGLSVLDIGCGGGLACEPLARMGASVTGADASEENIAIARVHAEQSGLEIDYRATTVEALAAEGGQYDAITALEIIEHVADPQGFLDTLATLLKPGGALILSTLNRTAQSYAIAILGAEYVLGWLPKGTHDWSRFPTPDEVDGMLEGAGLAPVDRRGMRFAPLTGEWALSRDLSVNYISTAVKPLQ